MTDMIQINDKKDMRKIYMAIYSTNPNIKVGDTIISDKETDATYRQNFYNVETKEETEVIWKFLCYRYELDDQVRKNEIIKIVNDYKNSITERQQQKTKTKILMDYEDDCYWVCIMCGAKARTKQALRIHSRHYHTDPPQIIPLDQASYWVDREREKMEKLEEQGKYNRDWIVEEDPNLHDELVKANIIMDEYEEVENNQILTPEILAKAIVNALKLRDYSMDYNNALEISEHILNFFGFEEQIIENVLENDDREILYFLENLGLVGFRVSTLTTYEGKEWNVSTVHLKDKKIFEFANKEIDAPREIEISEIYEKLPEEAWVR